MRLLAWLIVPLALASAPAAAQQSEAAAFRLQRTAPIIARTQLVEPPVRERGWLSQRLDDRAGLYAARPGAMLGFLPEIGGGKRGERGFSLSLKPSKSPKAVARLRF